jgi:hypothetical protein
VEEEHRALMEKDFEYYLLEDWGFISEYIGWNRLWEETFKDEN